MGRECGRAHPWSRAVGEVVKIRFLFAWYDLWIGAYWDKRHRRLYVLPLPCLGVVIQFAPSTALRKV